MEETALAFTEFASYSLTNILFLQNSLTFPWLLLLFQITLTNLKIPWLFPDFEKKIIFPWLFPDRGNPEEDTLKPV